MNRRAGRVTATGSMPSTSNSSSSHTLTVSDDSMNMDTNEYRETHNYKILLDAFIVMLQRDRDLLNYVFPNELQTLVFTKLAELPLVHMHETAQRLSESIKQLPNKVDSGKFAVYGIFAILRWFLKSRGLFIKISQDCDVTRRQQFTILSATFEQSGVLCLQAIIDEVANDPTLISAGGNVHPLTSYVLAFMEGLLAYEDTATIIASVYVEKEHQASSGGTSGPQKGLYDLGIYFSRLIQSLLANLAKKTDGTMLRIDTGIRSIFLLNNINYLLKRLENSTLLSLIQQCQPDFQRKCETDFQNAFRDFIKCYSTVTNPIQQMFDYDNSHHLPDTKLRDREREIIKESFSNVNATIDTMIQQCEQYIISDVHLRERLRNEVRKIVSDPFRKYYEKFARKDFTKNRDKYIRYRPETLDSLIGRLFEHHS